MHHLWNHVDFGLALLDAQGRVVGFNNWLSNHSRLLQNPMGLMLNEVYGADVNARLLAAVGQALTRGHSSRLSSALHPSPLPLYSSESDVERMRHAVDILAVSSEADGRQCLIQVRDMTESLRREELLRRQARQLQDSEQRLEAILNNAPIGMALSDTHGQWTYVNRALCGMLDQPAEALLHRPASGHVAPEDLLRHEDFEQSLLHGEVKASQIEKRWINRSGNRVWVRVTATRVQDAAGEQPYLIQQIEPIDDRKRKEAEIASNLSEKETLLREVYHRVKNNLQVIQSLLNLKRNSVADEAARLALAETAERVRSMALVHEKLYQSNQLSAIDLADYLGDLVAQLQDALGTRNRGITVLLDLQPVEADLNAAIPFGLIVTELLSNCLKHAFVGRDEGVVRIELKPQADGARLVIEDNGVGFSKELDLRGGKSLGLKLVDSLITQLDGELHASVGQGVRFELLLRRLSSRGPQSTY
jgi:PAS domain S-box-containing protein